MTGMTLKEMFDKILDTKKPGETVTSADDPMQRMMGFVVHKPGMTQQLFQISLKNIVSDPIPENVRAYMARPAGRSLIAGYLSRGLHPFDECKMPLEDMFPKEKPE